MDKSRKEYVQTNKMVIMNFSEKYCKNEAEVVGSKCFDKIWRKFVQHLIKIEKQDALSIINLVDNPYYAFIDFFKLLLCFEYEDIVNKDSYFSCFIEKREELYQLINEFYDYWRHLERYAITIAKTSKYGVDSSNFIESTNIFNSLVLRTYRTISEKIYGEKFPIYRQVPAGVNASLIVSKLKWMQTDSKYSLLRDVPFINQIIIRPPFIVYSEKNKRSGIYEEVNYNPIDNLELNVNDYFCYPAYVGSSLSYIYFHRDFMSHGIALCNLFEFVPRSDCDGKKPDIIYVFGAPIEGDSVFHHDIENDIYIGVAPHNQSIDYFGYMKKMLLTLYNVKMIDNGYLPLHGACVNITLKDGRNKNIVIIGDSGAGKSESLEALQSYAGDNISNMQTIFDDMGTFKLENGHILAYGTEIGAFVRLDDMSPDYAYKEMDRAIYMNPDKINSRLVIPVATYPQIMKGYKVDMVFYANNYEDTDIDIHFFDNMEEALGVFTRGARRAKGTTSEVGLVESFFANPFGPVQRKEKTTELLNIYFKELYKTKTPVGEIHTRLAVSGYEHDGPAKVAKALFKLLEK